MAEKQRVCTKGHCYCPTKLDGKVVIVTGSNTGIGKTTACDLAGRGATVILACRDVTKGKVAADWILEQHKDANAKVYKLDLSSLKSVKDFAEDVLRDYPEIHILINNAGVMYPPETETEDGFELQMAVNYLGHFLLTYLLLDRLKESAPSRIVNVASYGYKWAHLDPDDLFMKKRGYAAVKQSASCQLARVLFTALLAKKLEGTGVSAFSLHPGNVQTEGGRHLEERNFLLRGVLKVAKMFLMTAEQGAQTSVHCAVCPGLEEQSGEYFDGCKVEAMHANGRNLELGERVWKASEELTGISF